MGTNVCLNILREPLDSLCEKILLSFQTGKVGRQLWHMVLSLRSVERWFSRGELAVAMRGERESHRERFLSQQKMENPGVPATEEERCRVMHAGL